MTPAEMSKFLLTNIERVRAVMEDGPVGYVLHTADRLNMLCSKDGKVWLGNPQEDEVAVHTTHARAVVMQRYWNSLNSENKVSIALRREAMVAYIDQQEQALDTLLNFIEMSKFLEQPK